MNLEHTPLLNPPIPIRTSWSAAELMELDFPEPQWAVPGLICEGVSLLVGAPKVGKSWLSLGLGLAVAAGTPALGTIPVEKSPVLYLALEDTPRRLKTRLHTLLDRTPAPEQLILATSCPPIPNGGAEHIAHWIECHPDTRLVIIDVFAKIRGLPQSSISAYEADYASISQIKHIADTYNIAILLIHHIRKAGSEDFLQEVSGTNGIAGAADATLVLKRARGQADAMLHITGRDVEEAEHPLQFTPANGQWTILNGPSIEYTLRNTRSLIHEHLRHNPNQQPKDIAAALNLDPALIRRTCARMAQDHQLITHHGHYTIDPTNQPPLPLTPP